MLEVENLHVVADSQEIIEGVSFKIKPGEIHALMGPNGSGKSSLALALAGHPRYQITSGKATLDGKNITKLSPDKRAKLGLFLAMQNPILVPGVSTANFLRTSLRSLKREIVATKFIEKLKKDMKELKIGESLASRSINDGFSGGEKKKTEILQLGILKPKYAILDETDSGLDVDSLKLVAAAIKKAAGPNIGILLITHYPRILSYIKPDFVHVMIGGIIVENGDYKLAEKIEKEGYKSYGETALS